MKGLFGDTFVCDNIIFRIYTNYHPNGYFIAYPIYKIGKDNFLTSVRLDNELLEKYLKYLPNSNIKVPLIEKSKVERYFSCLQIGDKISSDFLDLFNYIKERLNKIEVNKVGLSGYVHLSSYGFRKLNDEKTDLDFVVAGESNCLKLRSKKDLLYDKNFKSYQTNYNLIYERRRRTTPYNIDLNTAKEFEAKKTLGILNGRHINITPTYKIKSDVLQVKGKMKNLGMIKVKLKIKDNPFYSVPCFYPIECRFECYDISYLVTNFFFYALNTEKRSFEVMGNLVELDQMGNKTYIISMENWGDYTKYYMNLN